MEWEREFIDQLHEMGLSFLPWPDVRRSISFGGKTMKTIAFAALVSFLTVSGLALAAQSGDQKEQPTTPSKPMMQEEMMKDGKEGEHMDGMLRMMKMMEQCSRMMESGQSDSGYTKEKRM
jgi:hypothetical protein